jgi:hypothetical protein
VETHTRLMQPVSEKLQESAGANQEAAGEVWGAEFRLIEWRSLFDDSGGIAKGRVGRLRQSATQRAGRTF